MDLILKDALNEIKPKNNLKQHRIVLNKIIKCIKKNKIKASALIGGSIAKGTFLNNYDCDIFVKFDLKYKNEDISALLLNILNNGFSDIRTMHGSRDYFNIRLKDVKYEVIPVLDVSSYKEARNVTDMSPLHVTWVKKNIGDLGNDVRLIKQFCKAQGVYGAESYINGFSGYILEVLIIHYKGLKNLIRAASEWKPNLFIDHEKQYKDRQTAIEKLNEAKTLCPLILIDPVQKDRNAAAALSLEKFSKFILAVKLFLNNPNKDFFIIKHFDLKETERKAKDNNVELVLFECRVSENKDDVAGSKIVKAFNYIKTKFLDNEFKILDSGWSFEEKVYLWYYVYPNVLPNEKVNEGPMIYVESEHIKRFIEKYPAVFVSESKIYAFAKRNITNIKDLVKTLKNDEYLKEKLTIL